MEELKILKPGKRKIPDTSDSTDESLPCTNDHRIVSSPEKIIDTQGPVSLGYGSADSGTPKSSVSPDLDAYPSAPEKLLKMSQGNVNDACPMSQDNVMSSR